jgi:hypothetical protein
MSLNQNGNGNPCVIDLEKSIYFIRIFMALAPFTDFFNFKIATEIE